MAPLPKISGNGRAVSRRGWLKPRNAEAGEMLEIETDAGLRVCRVNAVHAGAEFTVDVTTGMGVPHFTPRIVTIPGGVQVQGIQVSTGNPHFVIIVESADFSVDRQRWQSIGSRFAVTPTFRTRPTSNSCALLARARSRFASSSAAWVNYVVGYWDFGLRCRGHRSSRM